MKSEEVILIGADPSRTNVGSKTALLLEEAGFTCYAPTFAQLDISRPSDLNWIEWSRFDHLVLCNGWLKIRPIEQNSYQDIVDAVYNNLIGNLFAIRAFVKAHEEETPDHANELRIVNVGSAAAHSPYRQLVPYCAAKAGLNHAVRCLARELHPMGYRVFCVNPGKIEGTPMYDANVEGLMEARGFNRAQAESYFDDRMIMHRWQRPDDIAEIIVQCVQGKLDWLAGDSIWASGGPQ